MYVTILRYEKPKKKFYVPTLTNDQLCNVREVKRKAKKNNINYD